MGPKSHPMLTGVTADTDGTPKLVSVLFVVIWKQHQLSLREIFPQMTFKFSAHCCCSLSASSNKNKPRNEMG